MPVPEPAWKVRRRPCPFYWQGKCLFADSCNFLHSINPPAPVIVVDDASSDSQATNPRTSLDSTRSLEDTEHEELADDELETSSQDSNEDVTIHASQSNSWSHLSQDAQAMSTPPRPPSHVFTSSNHDTPDKRRSESDASYNSIPPHSTPPQSDRHSPSSGSDNSQLKSPSNGSDAVMGLGLILTPVSPPRASRHNFEDLRARQRNTVAVLSENAEPVLITAPEAQISAQHVVRPPSPDVLSVDSGPTSPSQEILFSPFRAQQALAHVMNSSLVSRRADALRGNSPPPPPHQAFSRPPAARRVSARLRSSRDSPTTTLKDTPAATLKATRTTTGDDSTPRDAATAAYPTPVSPRTSSPPRMIRDSCETTVQAIEPVSGVDVKFHEEPQQGHVESTTTHRPRVARDMSIDYTTEPESLLSASSKSSRDAAPTWLKPLRLSTLSPSLADDGTIAGPSSRPTSIYSAISSRIPSMISSRSSSRASSIHPLQPLSRSPSVLHLDTAIATLSSGLRQSSTVPNSASLSPSDHALRTTPQTAPLAPLLPPAQIFTSASRSLSPPSHQPLFKLGGPTSSEARSSRPTTPTIYSPSSAAMDRAASSLFFAIASDDKAQVTQSLKDDSTSPNIRLGPQEVPALVFAITNDQLNNKLPIVKTLLENGADPTVVYDDNAKHETLAPKVEDDITPAMKYYIERAEAMSKDNTIEALKKSELGNITAMNFRLVGQDHMLRYLYRALRLYVSGAVSTPFVSILTGPSGLGKSHIAKQFGEILGVPAHIINLSSLRSHSSLLEMKPALADDKVAQSASLQDFLAANEGHRCVVVLEDIEKVEDRNALHALIVPFELGRFLLSTGAYIDTSKVMWFATSSLGSSSVLEVFSPERDISDDDYRQMMTKARTELSAVLGASLVSRVGSVLPFVPFTDAEKSVIVCEAASTLLARVGESYSSEKMDHLVRKIVAEHPEIDGRGLLRAVAEQF